MSRIGKKPVAMPAGVTATTEGQILSVKGPKGTLSLQMLDEINYEIGDDGIRVVPGNDGQRARSFWGMQRSLVQNLVTGVTEGFTKTLEITGVGYREEALGAHAGLRIELKYFEGQPAIQHVSRVSKPGRRVYSGAQELPRVRNGLGITIVSTPRGVLSDSEAREQNVGGEILCTVF